MHVYIYINTFFGGGVTLEISSFVKGSVFIHNTIYRYFLYKYSMDKKYTSIDADFLCTVKICSVQFIR